MELEGQTLLNYSRNFSCFLCWNLWHKGFLHFRGLNLNTEHE